MHYGKKIILDFDGTIFRLFANYNMDSTILKLQKIFQAYHINFDLNDDIFDAFSLASCLEKAIREKVLYEINEIITKIEIDALDSGILVTGFLDFLDYIKKNKMTLAIVTNNSKECVELFFQKYCGETTFPILGRIWNRPECMKPDVYLLKEMSKQLNSSNKEIVFIGDNPRDYECAKSFQCEFFGLTPTESKKKRMTQYTNEIEIFNDFYELINYCEALKTS